MSGIFVVPVVINGTDAVPLLRELLPDSHTSHCVVHFWTGLHQSMSAVLASPAVRRAEPTGSDCCRYDSKPDTGMLSNAGPDGAVCGVYQRAQECRLGGPCSTVWPPGAGKHILAVHLSTGRILCSAHYPL